MPCERLAEVLPAVAEGQAPLGRSDRRHVEQCLRCQAEVAQYRKLYRAMRALRSEVLVPAPGLLEDVLAEICEAGERQALRSIITGRRVAYLSGIAAATAAGVGSAIVLARRRRLAA